MRDSVSGINSGMLVWTRCRAGQSIEEVAHARGSTGGSLVLLPGTAGEYDLGTTLKGQVHNGRLVVDEPTELPEGTEVVLLPLDPGDWLDPTDRAALHRALAASQEDTEAGRLFDAEEVLKELRTP